MKKKPAISRAAEIRTLILIAVVIVIPALGAVFAITATSQPDLSDLTPVSSPVENYFVLDWSSLLRDHAHALNASSGMFTGAAVRALGYMVDGDRVLREGAPVQDFVLLPEAGNLLHPAHRFGDQMVAVHLDDNSRIRFSLGAMVWVWGAFRASPGDPAGPKPLYSLERAHALPADKKDIRTYFK